jgi:nitrogenase subunit NifH
MATTRLIPMHVIKGKTASQSVEERLKYAMNEDKTENGTLVSAYGCDPKTAVSEMLLCRKQHEILNGNSEPVEERCHSVSDTAILQAGRDNT